MGERSQWQSGDVYQCTQYSIVMIDAIMIYHHPSGPERRMQKYYGVTWLLVLFAFSAHAAEVRDDAGNVIVLNKKPDRIVSLAPHVTEMLFAIGAGDSIAGAVEYSDYPDQARSIPRVGGYSRLDVERIVALNPDLVVAWQDGNGSAAINRIRQLGLTVYVTEPVELLDVASNMQRLSLLTGTRHQGSKAAQQFRNEYRRLQLRYARKKSISVFYQLWHKPLMTATDRHLIGKVVNLCGGNNVFAGLAGTTPKIDLEAVLAVNPQAIVASGMSEARPEWLDHWRQWPQLQAVKHGHLYFVPPDILQRHSPRILQGAKLLCQALEQARQNL